MKYIGYADYGVAVQNSAGHGDQVTAYAAGTNYGVARRANVVFVQTVGYIRPEVPIERFLESLVNACNDIAPPEGQGQRKPKHSLVMVASWGVYKDWADDHIWRMMRKIPHRQHYSG